MIDNSKALRNFKETLPKTPGSLPILPFVNVKDVMLGWLEHRFKSMNLTKPVVLLGDYPSQTTLSNLPVGEDGTLETNNLRGVSVVLLDGSTDRQGIGQVINTKENDNDPEEKGPIEYGWYERIQIEVSYWSVSSRDRDYGGDLVRSFMLEGFRSGWFLQNGIVEMHLHNYYDTADTRLEALNRHLSYSVSTFSLSRVFLGTLDMSELDLPRIEDIEWKIEIPGDGHSDEENKYNKTMGPLPPIHPLQNFGRMDEDCGRIVLPGGTAYTFLDYKKHNSAEKSTDICTGEII